MRIIISPAKKMNVDCDSLPWRNLPQMLPRSEELLETLRAMTGAELKALWKCNDALASLNIERLSSMNLKERLTPAILAYEGIQYQYMAPNVFTAVQYAYIEEHLRILSGFYGILRPFDGVTPYRLEMQAKLETRKGKDLYSLNEKEAACSIGFVAQRPEEQIVTDKVWHELLRMHCSPKPTVSSIWLPRNTAFAFQNIWRRIFALLPAHLEKRQTVKFWKREPCAKWHGEKWCASWRKMRLKHRRNSGVLLPWDIVLTSCAPRRATMCLLNGKRYGTWFDMAAAAAYKNTGMLWKRIASRFLLGCTLHHAAWRKYAAARTL